MAFAGKLGCRVDLSMVGAGASEPLRSDHKLFSESNSRWVVEVPKDKEAAFKALFEKAGLGKLVLPLGDATRDGRVVVVDGKHELLDVSAEACREAWRTAMPKLMGVAA
jgi:phosphoribosylformylglycinamidine synthase